MSTAIFCYSETALAYVLDIVFNTKVYLDAEIGFYDSDHCTDWGFKVFSYEPPSIHRSQHTLEVWNGRKVSESAVALTLEQLEESFLNTIFARELQLYVNSDEMGQAIILRQEEGALPHFNLSFVKGRPKIEMWKTDANYWDAYKGSVSSRTRSQQPSYSSHIGVGSLSTLASAPPRWTGISSSDEEIPYVSTFDSAIDRL